jgi:hypothetical protein
MDTQLHPPMDPQMDPCLRRGDGIKEHSRGLANHKATRSAHLAMPAQAGIHPHLEMDTQLHPQMGYCLRRSDGIK